MAAGVGGIKAGKAFILIEAVDKVSGVLKGMKTKLMNFGSEVSSIGKGIAAKMAAALVPVGLGAGVFIGFDDSMKRVEARSKGTAAEMGQVRAQAEALGAETAFTSGQIGMLQAKMAQKGFNRGQILDMTEGVTNLALAAGEGVDLSKDATDAANLVTGTLRAFQMDAAESGRVADVFTAAINGSNASMEGLITSMTYAGPIAQEYKVGLEETVATLAGMTNLNIDPSMAGTAFRNMLLYMSDKKAVSDFNDELKKLTNTTVKFTDDSGNLRSLPELLFDIGDATKDLGTATKGDMLGKLFGMRAIVPAAALMKGENAFASMTTTLKNAGGQAKRTRQLMDSGLGGTFRELSSKVEAVGIALGGAFEESLRAIAPLVFKIMEGFIQWINQNGALVTTIVASVAGLLAFGLALWAAGAAIGVVATLVGGLIAILGVLKAVALLAFSPIALALAAIGIAAFVLRDTLKDSLGGIAGTVTETVGGAVEKLSEWFSGLLKTATTTFAGVSDAMKAGDTAMAFEILTLGLSAAWSQFADGAMAVWDGFNKYVVDNFSKAMQDIENRMLKVSRYIASSAAFSGLFQSKAEVEKGKRLDKELAELQARTGQKVNTSPNNSTAVEAVKLIDGQIDANEDWGREIDGRDAKRQAAAAERQKAIQDKIAALEAKAAEAKAAAAEVHSQELQDEIYAQAMGDGKPNLDPALMGPREGVQQHDAPQGPIEVAPTSLKWLQKGSAEAMQQFQENMFRAMQKDDKEGEKQLAAAEKAADHLENIDDKLGELNGAVGV